MTFCLLLAGNTINHFFASNLIPTYTPLNPKNKKHINQRSARSNFCLCRFLSLSLSAISSPVFTAEWKATVVKSLDALVTSCVVVPCSFTHPHENLSSSRLKGIWHLLNKQKEYVYYEDESQILEKFRGRTQLLGQLGQNNCTLKIIDVKDHDNGPFCFRIELATNASNGFSFRDCVNLKMLRMSFPTFYKSMPIFYATMSASYFISSVFIYS